MTGYWLNDEELAKAKTDLLFKLAMAKLAEKESDGLRAEADEAPDASHKDLQKLIFKQLSKREHAETSKKVLTFAGKVVTKVAVVVFCVVLLGVSTLAISEEARKSVYRIITTDMGRYTSVSFGESSASFVDSDIYVRKDGGDVYAPTWVPKGYELDRETVQNDWYGIMTKYNNGDNFIWFRQADIDIFNDIHVDSENAERTENIYINGESAILNIKYYGETKTIKFITLIWKEDSTAFILQSNGDENDVIKFAENVMKK